MSKVLVDACVFINAMKSDSIHRDECLAFLEILSKADRPILMPAHGWFEVWCNLKRIEKIDKKFQGAPINGQWAYKISLIHIDDRFIAKYGNMEIPYAKAGDHIYLVLAYSEDYRLVTTDNGMRKVAQQLGVPVFSPSEFVATQRVA